MENSELEKQIRKLGAAIPCYTGGTFENDPLDAIIDAAYRVFTRTQPRVPVETPWTCAGHGDNFNDGCAECEWVATCNRYEEHIAKVEAQPRVTVEEVAYILKRAYCYSGFGVIQTVWHEQALALKAAHPHLFKE